MISSHLPIIPICNQCRSACGISFDFLELMERLLVDEETENLSEFDQAIEESIAGEHKHEHRLDEYFFPFPISIDVEKEALFIMAWCPRCRKLRESTISLAYLLLTAKDHKKGGSFETPDQSPD